ncbi:ribose-5-phosphate isomerase [Thermoproteus uzoniensis 768-20]|uniref:Ribose 5-phosphate isomerase A n=1 Tax=Thermoproteus uzoniensis (strain 768-20) TaxID=999630 RepID=F2L1R1_THEU7|nr:ribose 5-phosphate isomerase A [Thermoproteus uzoniensis]AEA12917.1 ribose-5-phosphate isomerase [Thermoproteus uzoniensis 768-20]
MKELLARKAVEFVRDGSVVGLGSGSTAKAFIEELSRAVAEKGIRVTLVATSIDSELKALEVGLGPYLVPPWAVDSIDLAVDGADEISRDRMFIKGGGGAMVREKVVDYRASTLVIIAEAHKLVDRLPSNRPIPIEVLPAAWRLVARDVERRWGGKTELRACKCGGKLGPLISDNGNFILDWVPPGPAYPELEDELKAIPGVVDTGLFAKRRDAVILLADERGVFAL